MTTTKRFAVRVLLTATTERLLTDLGDLYVILEWMTGEPPCTHQLPRFNAECKPWLLRWFPELAKWDAQDNEVVRMVANGGGRPAVEEFVQNRIEVYSLRHEYDVPRIPRDDHAQLDPVEELIDMVGDKSKVITVEVPE